MAQKAYKLVRKLKDGSLAPLFINKRLRLTTDEWLEAASRHWHLTLVGRIVCG